jgi:hypothetical protein
MEHALIRWRLFLSILLAAALLQGCSKHRSAPVRPSANAATIPYDNLLTGGSMDWPDISKIRDGSPTAPSASGIPSNVPTSAPSAKFSTEVDEIVGRLIVLARKLTNGGEYGAALRICEAILLLDPKNDYALGVRPLLEDRRALPPQRRYDEVRP